MSVQPARKTRRPSDPGHQRAIRSWVMYDWANSAFATTIMAAVLPVFFAEVAAKGRPGASVFWGYTQSAAMLAVALIVPVLGAIADYSSSKVRFLRIFSLLGIFSTGLLYFVKTGDYILCALLYMIGVIGFSGGNVFYDSLLPDVAEPDEVDYVSSKGFAFGYLGGGILLALNLLMIQAPKLLGIPDTVTGTRLAFVTVAVWWLIFSIPLFRNVKERIHSAPQAGVSYVAVAFGRLGQTLREMRRYRDLTKFIFAFWLYNDGINTIITMATIYGHDIGIGTTHLIGALLLTQIVGIPFSLLFGRLPERLGTKNSIFLGIAIYTGITVVGFMMTSAWQFWLLAFLVGTVQGGTQALSRSLYASMVPEQHSAEFFSFLALSSKFASIMGPFIFALVGQLTGSSRYGIISLILFFVCGGALLATVDVAKGQAVAKATK